MAFWEKVQQVGGEILAFIGFGILAVAVELVMTSKIKVWKKTTFFLIIAESLAAFFAFLAWNTWDNGDTLAAIVVGVIAALLAVGFCIGGIYGHRKGWKQHDE